jgi:hypothetical protein
LGTCGVHHRTDITDPFLEGLLGGTVSIREPLAALVENDDA